MFERGVNRAHKKGMIDEVCDNLNQCIKALKQDGVQNGIKCTRFLWRVNDVSDMILVSKSKMSFLLLSSKSLLRCTPSAISDIEVIITVHCPYF